MTAGGAGCVRNLVRPIERLQQNLAISVPTCRRLRELRSKRREMEEVKRGYQENRRILIEGLPHAVSTNSCPRRRVYLYADVSEFTSDSSSLQTMLNRRVSRDPGIDFDPVHGISSFAFYARSAEEMREAVAASRGAG